MRGRETTADGEAFRLENVSVGFRRNTIHERSLKHALAALARRNGAALHRAIADLSLSIRRGEHLGVIGRNAAGKSTLARVIVPQAGRVHVDARCRVVPLLELGIGFQPDLSGVENCHLAGALMGYSFDEIERRLPGIVEFAELEEFIREPVRTYSSGMYARLAFALATDVEPDVLLIDEVFGVGDEFFTRKCLERMKGLMARGSTTVLVSHDLELLQGQCDRMIWLDQGRIVMDGAPEAVAAAYRAGAGHAPRG
jgi:ABC-type polysaccharide/polyol phosphate transport system ATPase subunit